jgi:hypothetical protein
MSWATTSSVLNIVIFMFGLREEQKSMAVNYRVKRRLYAKEKW